MSARSPRPTGRTVSEACCPQQPVCTRWTYPGRLPTSPQTMIARMLVIDNVLGIDISKDKFDVALRRPTGAGRSRAFANQETGFAQLRQWLRQLGVERVHACLEATGSYGWALA